MTDAILDIGAIVEPTLPWLATACQFPFGDGQPPADGSYPFGILYVLPLAPPYPVPLTGVETVWPQKLQVTTVGRTASQAKAAAARVLRAMAGQNTDGGYLVNAPVIDGLTVIRRRSDRDGHADQADGLYQWAETFTWDIHLD